MKTVLLHGLGQTAQDWKEVVQQLSISDVDCPELFSSAEDEISYSQILGDLEQRYSEVKEPLRICGLSLGALLAIDFSIRHEEKVASLVLIGAQYKVPSLLIDFQNLIFRCMPDKAFESMGLSKSSTIKLAHSMRSLDFTSQLNNIRCPVTILCGKKDAANLKASKRLKELLPQATLHIVPNAGHELNKYAPNTIAEILNTLLLKGQMTHRATLGTDPRGNLTRIDNALAQMPQRLEAAKAQLDNLYQQQAAAKEEVGKPFLYEEELRSKNARLVELDTLLNIDGKGQAHAEAVVAKSARPSVLDHLKRPATSRSTDKKPKQHEEVR